MTLTGTFDWDPSEEVYPIRLGDRLVVLYGPEVETQNERDFALSLHRHKIFGTGGHPSSRMAVWGIHSVVHRYHDGEFPPGASFMEIGATTGLLALVAASCGAGDCFTCSDSIEAQALSDDNGILNGFDLKIAEAAEFFGMWQFVREKGPLEVEPQLNFVATQVGGCNSVINYIPDIHAALLPGGAVIWSGLTARQLKPILHRLGEFFHDVEVFNFEGWPVITCIKKNEPI